MKKFMEVMKINFKSLFQYKWTFAMSLMTQPIIFVIDYIVFRSIYSYGGRTDIQGYTMEQMVWFFTANLLVNAFVWNPCVGELSGKILSGDLSTDLLRPISFYRYEMARCVSSRFISIIVDFLPGIILYSLILPPKFITFISLIKAFLVIIPAFFLNYITASLIGLCAMWVKNSSSLYAISTILISFAGGCLIPMEFYPAWLVRLTDFLPYKYIYYLPIQFILNREMVQGSSVLVQTLLIQMAWILALRLLYQLAWKHLLEHYGAVGG